MKKDKAIRGNAKSFVASLYAGGKRPCERFGLSWDSLSRLERKIPSITCKSEDEGCKIA
ncbi:hypothetical protein VR7878_04008 [Vibrio ruber DSM 16370]|uniref:Uncharacterized protein n=1 Tax=Vibrio ruber (strain DSM 16370 / JCM 11486 / BCRC 17186 / CECT 7878 / LMG 23124 / VR1) TaxID=1123498 RepID=A0A1R4LUX6_VIBR1|nr:hypothetical protein VR7878_04008 [Vibrio ruber DSM 16370]